MKWLKKGLSILLGVSMLMVWIPQGSTVHADSVATINVNTSEVINDNFLGIGAEYDPFHFMPESVANGFHEQWWEVEKRRIAKIKPALVRVWYQIDWMEPVNDNNDPNVINWSALQTSSVKMQSLYTVLDFLKSEDIDVMLVAGWKMDTSVQSWLGFNGLEKPETSAPTDLAEWAEWVSASLQQLIINKGYTNIKYVQSYNEPNLGDFEAPSHIDQKSYYEQMYRAIHQRLVADGIRSQIQLAGPDESSGLDWIEYAADQMDDILDVYQGHAYGKDYASIKAWIDERQGYVADTGKPLLITEFAAPGDKTTYQNGVELADLIVSGMQNNASAMLLWRMADQFIPSPLNFLDSSQYGMWGWLPTASEPRYTYYSLSLFTRFIGKQAKVLTTTSTDPDLHVTSVERTDGTYSVFVVNKNMTESKQVSLQFSKSLSQDFRRHVYSEELERTANATIAPADKQWLNVGSSLSDASLPPNSVAVYTSTTEPIQIDTIPSAVSAALGASITFDHEMHGASHAVNWSVLGDSSYGSINTAGHYNAPTSMPDKQEAVIKATSIADAEDYDLAIVRFRVTGLIAQSSNNEVLLQWEPSIGAASYTVKRSLTSGGPYSTIATNVNTTSYSDPTAQNGTAYYYVVNAVNAHGSAAPSLEATATPTSNSMEDDFNGSSLDSSKWITVNQGLRSNADTGMTAAIDNDALKLSGTTSVNYWGGKGVRSVTPFHATAAAPLEVEVERVSLSGTGTGARSVLWLYVDSTNYIHFSQNMDTGVWAYNLNGGSDTLIYDDDDYGNHKMKLVHDSSTIRIYIDDIERASVAVSWNENMYVALTGSARAAGDTMQVIFDNLKVEPITLQQSDLLADDFNATSIDTAKWSVVDKGFRSSLPSGITATITNQQLDLSGTTSVNYWGGKTLKSTATFQASAAEPLTVEVDRISLSGNGTGARSALWLYIADNQSLHVSHNTDTGVWSYNLNGAGDTLVYADNDTGNHRIKLVHDGTSIGIYLNDTLHTTVPVAWNSNMHVMLTGEARASGDSVSAIFDNLVVTQ